MSNSQQRLLVLSCSARKRVGSEPMPAIERYNGPAFGVLRKYLQTEQLRAVPAPDVYILSAELGLLPLNHPIQNYDRRMTPLRAQEIAPVVTQKFQQIVTETSYTAFCCCLGKTYLQAIQQEESFSGLPDQMIVDLITGSSGRRLSQLRDWLHGTPTAEARGICPADLPHRTSFRGLCIETTPAKIYDAARIGLRHDGVRATETQTWYVSVDEYRVSPKWLVSLLTTVPVSCFHSDDARRVLTQLGIEIRKL